MGFVVVMRMMMGMMMMVWCTYWHWFEVNRCIVYRVKKIESTIQIQRSWETLNMVFDEDVEDR